MEWSRKREKNDEDEDEEEEEEEGKQHRGREVDLESANVVVITVESAKSRERYHCRVAWSKCNAQCNQTLHPIPTKLAQIPRHDRTPVMPHHIHLQSIRRLIESQRL